MSKNKYGHIKKDIEKILAMKAAGYKKCEIAEELRLTKEQVKEFLKRQRRKALRIAAGLLVRSQVLYREILSWSRNMRLGG